MWKEKSLKGGIFSKVVTTSDEPFAFFIMRDYDRLPTKEDSKKDKLAGDRLENVMQFFDGMMKEIKLMNMEHSEWIPHLDDDIWDYTYNSGTTQNKRSFLTW